MSETYVALLRGINVGGNNKLPMADLREMFIAAGCAEVKSYIQSGNVIFKATRSEASEIPGIVGARIAATFGYRTPLLLRTVEQLGDVLQNNPFLTDMETDDRHYVMFLDGEPDPARVESLDPNLSAPDRYELRGQEVYLSLRAGAATTRLTNNYFDTKLRTISTMRNWRTVTTLLELMGGS